MTERTAPTTYPGMETETKSKNLLVEMARKKAADQAAGKRPGPHFTGRPSKRLENSSYTWRGGRNGNGKP